MIIFIIPSIVFGINLILSGLKCLKKSFYENLFKMQMDRTKIAFLGKGKKIITLGNCKNINEIKKLSDSYFLNIGQNNIINRCKLFSDKLNRSNSNNITDNNGKFSVVEFNIIYGAKKDHFEYCEKENKFIFYVTIISQIFDSVKNFKELIDNEYNKYYIIIGFRYTENNIEKSCGVIGKYD